MADDKVRGAPANPARIVLGEDDEAAFWTKRFGVSRARLNTAVRKVGDSPAAVERFLRL